MFIIELFSGDFQGQEGVRIMHQCALYNPKYGNFFYFVILMLFAYLIYKILRYIQIIFMD